MDVKVDMVQDSIGQLCPMPIAFLARNMKKLEAGQVLEIRADDEGAHADIPAWCEQTGNEFLGEEPGDGYFRYYVRKKGSEMSDNNKATLVVFSGDMDKVFAALTIATGCAAAGMDTTLFFTFWGLNAIKTGKPIKAKSFLGKMMALMNRGGINRLNPSHFSFGGIGRILFNKMMRDKKVALLEELRQTAIDLGVHFLACKTSMDVLEITRDDLIPEVEDIVGVATMVKEAANSKIQLFI